MSEQKKRYPVCKQRLAYIREHLFEGNKFNICENLGVGDVFDQAEAAIQLEVENQKLVEEIGGLIEELIDVHEKFKDILYHGLDPDRIYEHDIKCICNRCETYRSVRKRLEELKSK